MDNESTCFDPVTGTMRVLVVKAGVIACLAVMAYGASIFTARQTLQESKREVFLLSSKSYDTSFPF